MQYQAVPRQQDPPKTKTFRKYLRPTVDIGGGRTRLGRVGPWIKLTVMLLAALGGAVALLLVLDLV